MRFRLLLKLNCINIIRVFITFIAAMYDSAIQAALDTYHSKKSNKLICYNVEEIVAYLNVISNNNYLDLVIRCVLYISYYNKFDVDLFVLIISDSHIELHKHIYVNYFEHDLLSIINAEYKTIPSDYVKLLYNLVEYIYNNTDYPNIGYVCKQVIKGLKNRYGQLPKSLIIYLINKEVTIEDLITNKLYIEYKKYKFRNIIRVQMTDIISKFSKDAEMIAARIERSCYNKAIDQCKLSSESYVRQWDSSMWINVYSAKTGIIFTHMDPDSTVVKKYGNIIYKILSNEINIDNIGYMSEYELCPIANEKIRIDINNRMNQKVEVRSSNMFKCPKCGTRDAEYKSVQLRGPDEPTTYVCRCNKCKQSFHG